MEIEKKGDMVFQMLCPLESNGETNLVEILRLGASGDIFVKGKLAETSKEVVDGMREFLAKANRPCTACERLRTELDKMTAERDEARRCAVQWEAECGAEYVSDTENTALFRRIANENYPGEADRLFPTGKAAKERE